MKAAIIEFFKSNRTYHAGVSLYMQYGIRQSLRKQLNVQSYSRDLELMLFEELRSMAEIPVDTFRIMISTPIQTIPVVIEQPVDSLEIPVIIANEKDPEVKKKPPRKFIKPKHR